MQENRQETEAPMGQPGNAIDEVMDRAQSSDDPKAAGLEPGKDHTDPMPRDESMIWEVRPEDTSLAAGTPPDVRDGQAGGEAGMATSGTGSGGSQQQGQAFTPDRQPGKQKGPQEE